ncbi:MAG: NAD(P)-dependent oxidoreductase [Alphaproteobacteria bacterium]
MLQHSDNLPATSDRVVVIGASGVLGKALIDRLNTDKIPVLGLGSQQLDLLSPDAGDRLADTLRAGDAVVLLSALTPDRGRGIPALMKNLRMAEAVCQAITAVEPAHVIYLSSDAVYPMGTDVLTEQSPAAPTDLYGVMHRSRELMFGETVPADRLAILRCTLVLSAVDTHNSYGPNRFRQQGRTDGKIGLGGEGEETRDHILDSDVAEVIVRVLKQRSHGVLNTATGVSHSFADVARLVAANLSPSPEVAFSPRHAPITHRHFDIRATRLAFPDLRFTPLEEAIQRVHAALPS